MNILNWIDRNLNDLKKTPLFTKYFTGINAVKGEGCYYITNPEKGIGLVLSEDFIVTSIHLYSGRNTVGNEYIGDLPQNLKFSMSRTNIRALLGEPDKQGGGYVDIFGTIPFWDKYYFDKYSLHCQYSSGISYIDMITIGSLSLESYFGR